MKDSRTGYSALQIFLCLLLVAMTCLPAAAMAQEDEFVMMLPEKTRVIEDYAFSGNRQITAVNLPEGLFSIGAYAFDGCDEIKEVYIPSSVEEIGEGAFPKGTVIACDDDSYAQTWIEENGYTRSRKYYALLIGQEYTGKDESFPGRRTSGGRRQSTFRTRNRPCCAHP